MQIIYLIVYPLSRYAYDIYIYICISIVIMGEAISIAYLEDVCSVMRSSWDDPSGNVVTRPGQR